VGDEIEVTRLRLVTIFNAQRRTLNVEIGKRGGNAR